MPSARAAIIAVALLITGSAGFFWCRQPAREGKDTPAIIIGDSSANSTTRPEAEVAAPAPSIPPATATLEVDEARSLGTADLALRIAALPQGYRAEELPEFARLLAARGPESVVTVASALATAGSDTARGVLADALALIGTADAVQELCAAAVQAPDDSGTAAIASAFRGLGNPDTVPMLASVFSQTEDPQLLAEAGAAIRRLADANGVLALSDLMKEDGQLHSQRAALLEILAGVSSPAARPALEALAADETDPECAAAASRALGLHK